VFFALGLMSEGSERSCLIAYIALVCVVSLLFPVISMTDDLNSSPAMPEATKLKHLLPSALFLVRLFSNLYAPSERIWAALALEQEQKPVQQGLLYFNLSRRPPPSLASL
jgi:hypothetical protein